MMYLLWSIVIVVLVLFMAYFSTKFIAKRFGGTVSGKGMRVLERLSLSPDKMLIIADICGKTVLIGVSPGGINKILDIDNYDDFIANIECGELSNGSFSDILGTISRKNVKKDV